MNDKHRPASFQNIWMGILPATGFFNINNGSVRIAILLAIAGLVIIALYPKKKKMDHKNKEKQKWVKNKRKDENQIEKIRVNT